MSREENTKVMVQQSGGSLSGNVQEIDLLDLLGFYMSRLPSLIIAVVVGALVAGLYTHYLVPDRFTAVSRTYMVSASSDSVVNLTDLNIGTSLSNDYVELMKSRPVVEEVIDYLELDYTYEQLVNMISLNVVSNTRIVRISATSTDPQEAMEISNQLAKTAMVQLPKVMDAPSPTIVEEAVFPTHRSSPSLSRNVLIGAMLALIAVLGVLTVIYLLDDTIKSSEDMEKEFGIIPLTVIPEGVIDGQKNDEKETGRAARRRRKNARKGAGA